MNFVFGQPLNHSNIKFTNTSLEVLVNRLIDSFTQKKNYSLLNKDSIRYVVDVFINDSVYKNGDINTLIIMQEQDYIRVKNASINNFYGYIFYKDLYFIFNLSSRYYERYNQLANPFIFFRTKCDVLNWNDFYDEKALNIQLEFYNGILQFNGITTSNFIEVNSKLSFEVK